MSGKTKLQEWKTLDRSTWRHGEWDDEPDKVQWKDAATGLPCLAVRNSHSGNWCGYVGVAGGHPWHGKDYSQCLLPTAAPRGPRDGDAKFGERWAKQMAERLVCTEDYCDHRVDAYIRVHGGVTFSGACADTSAEAWKEWCKHVNERTVEEAKKHPKGDAARLLLEWGEALESHDKYRELSQARRVCHIPEPGEPDHVWWFGFDCAHAWDVSPSREWTIGYDTSYKTLRYVQDECAKLAHQLAERSKGPGHGE